ncbi:putative lysosomal alpha-glucosidase [Ixodes scapularis]
MNLVVKRRRDPSSLPEDHAADGTSAQLGLRTEPKKSSVNAKSSVAVDDSRSKDSQCVHGHDLLIISRTKRGYADNVTLGRVRVFGVSTEPTTASLEGRSVKFDYNETTEVLTLLDLDQPMDEDFTVTWT